MPRPKFYAISSMKPGTTSLNAYLATHPSIFMTTDPKARIVMIMRDPVERTISHYWYMVRSNGERRTMLNAIKVDADYCDTSN